MRSSTTSSRKVRIGVCNDVWMEHTIELPLFRRLYVVNFKELRYAGERVSGNL